MKAVQYAKYIQGFGNDCFLQFDDCEGERGFIRNSDIVSITISEYEGKSVYAITYEEE